MQPRTISKEEILRCFNQWNTLRNKCKAYSLILSVLLFFNIPHVSNIHSMMLNLPIRVYEAILPPSGNSAVQSPSYKVGYIFNALPESNYLQYNSPILSVMLTLVLYNFKHFLISNGFL